MPKTSNKTTAAKTATPAKTATAAKVKKTTTTKRAKTAPAAVETTPTPSVNEVTAAPVETEAAAPSVLTELAESSTEFLSRLNAVASQLSALRTEFRTLEKRWTRELKAAERAQAKRAKKRNGARAPSGFVKPTLISNELASFLGKPSGTEMARTEVTKEINKYIVAHSLKDASNGRKINPNSALRSLLNIEANQELTYFNLQRYMSPHFAKSGQTEPFSTSA